MTLLFLFTFGVGLCAVSGRLVARAVVIPRLQLRQHLREISDYGFEQPIGAETTSDAERLRRAVRRFAGRVGAFLITRFPSIPALPSSALTAAGFYDLTQEELHGARVLAAIGLPTFIGGLLILSGHSMSMLEILLVIVSAAGGWILPSFYVRKRGSSRLEEIDRRLPELIDVLIATVEAGMGFGAALSLVAERFEGAIGAELKLMMSRQSLGMTVQEAMDEFVERCDTPSIRAFVRTASRGETLGVSIGPVLRELSTDQRRRHRQAAREKMQKAPIKMLFPLMFLVFPALMIVLLYPAAYSVMHNLKGVL